MSGSRSVQNRHTSCKFWSASPARWPAVDNAHEFRHVQAYQIATRASARTPPGFVSKSQSPDHQRELPELLEPTESINTPSKPGIPTTYTTSRFASPNSYCVCDVFTPSISQQQAEHLQSGYAGSAHRRSPAGAAATRPPATLDYLAARTRPFTTEYPHPLGRRLESSAHPLIHHGHISHTHLASAGSIFLAPTEDVERHFARRRRKVVPSP